MKQDLLYESESHSWVAFGRDTAKDSALIDTNQYLIGAPGSWALLDPGGIEIFPQVLEAISSHADVRDIKSYFCSHQDPDCMSSLPLWLGLDPDSRVLMPWLWTSFMSHFGPEFRERFVALPDEGGSIPVGQRGATLEIVPAHYCHSPGNYSVYDRKAKILFSGDIGAALLPAEHEGLYVDDFEHHVGYMKKFHERWMPSNRAKNDWVARVRRLEVDYLCPQHGAIFRGPQVTQFLDWFENLTVGVLG